MAGDFLTITEAADALGVSTRHVHRLADAGAVTQIARGLIDHDSIDRYLASQRQGRTRVWAEHTAWGAVALLSSRDAEWLGPTQTSRLKSALRSINTAEELVTRMRERTQVHMFYAHPSVLPNLRTMTVASDLWELGLTAAPDSQVDGYLPAADLRKTISSLGLLSSTRGNVTLRATTFDFDVVRSLVETVVVAGLDAATSTDPRICGVGRRALTELLEAYR